LSEGDAKIAGLVDRETILRVVLPPRVVRAATSRPPFPLPLDVYIMNKSTFPHMTKRNGGGGKEKRKRTGKEGVTFIM